jgi:predicted outer membrane protein
VQQKKIKADLPTNLDSHQKLIDDLNSASTQDFDKTYAKQQIDAPRPQSTYSKNTRTEAVKQFAQKTLPTIEQHLDEAKKHPARPQLKSTTLKSDLLVESLDGSELFITAKPSLS